MSAPTPVYRLQTHYFAIFAVFGAVTPFIPIYLRDSKGLSPSQIGLIFAIAQIGVLLMPVLMTYIADRYRIVRALLIVLFSCNVLAMGNLIAASGFLACLIWISVNRLATQPQVALGDGLYFTMQADPEQPRARYSRVRVWGTIGFIFPSLLMFGGYAIGGGVHWLPALTIAMAAIGIVNALGMPKRTVARERPPTVPTLEAAKVLCRPPILLFVLGVGCVIFTNMAFYGFYPLYLTEQVDLGERWVGIVSSIGVTLEIFYILALDRLRRRFGLTGLVLIGAAASLFRLFCLGWLPSQVFAIGFQAFHGLTVIAFMTVPVLYLNDHAREGYRNSIQGLYVMIVNGVFSIAGNIAAGELAEIGLLTLYRISFGVCVLGVVLILISFWLDRRATASARATPPR